MKSSAKRSRAASRSPRRNRRKKRLLVSCEHGGNEVPAEYAPLFAGAERVLDSHRGLDYGALQVARAFGERLGIDPITATTTRLVVDLNRSPYHRNVFSEYTRPLDRARRAAALDKHYWPYRRRAEAAVERAVRAGRFVLHVSSHSFTPELAGEVRNCDIGFLYDPRRPSEVRFIDAWDEAVRARAPELVARRNYPYKGVSDSLVTHLRRRHPDRSYAGVELEVNQKHVGSAGWGDLVALLADALAAAVR
jgi:predicted N-formylglutamate amidohydrolase